ncbi:hypothetical protein GLOTRDRAFT_93132 [Gloeophyllum trabeum ATCC 11539]|uniref:F-box domain-containing protein n=1 Tax=Gloeophyllum trabeum (strain ATCC 11539 / FP-39264 / Madison 617) TaxID=670483 RepID=S7RM79_GLOTA|nr:uncharacterized protein GLOTRDRAFT_93132 [Gloeophyllum trabeum ATCC 11539]EPQ55500.1 hypothetical protein GLOTRDRAFT_93132 [Gloeophyllum trabeum ATCC 11539]
MHQCLQISEILCLIVKFISEGRIIVPWEGDNPIIRRDLLSLTLTCKTIHGVAVAALWKRQDSFVPLLKCLPSDLWHFNPVTNLMSFCRPLVPTDWVRFQHYAPSVQSLTVGSDVAPEALENLAMYGPLGPDHGLLPNLRTLSFSVKHVESLVHLIIFLNPNLRSLEINDGGWNLVPDFSGLGDVLGDVAPLLANLALRMPPSVENIDIRRSTGALTSFSSLPQHLKTISWDIPFDLTDVIHLAALPQLTHVSIFLPDNIADVQLLQTSVHGNALFPALRCLELRAQSLLHGKIFLNFLGKHTLERLVLCADEIPDEQDLDNVAEVLKSLRRNSGDPHVLESLTVSCDDLLDEAEDYALPFDVLRKNLLIFHNMKQLALDVPVTVNGDDDNLEELAQALPHIEKVQLGSRPTAQHTSFTLRGLSSFARHCASIRWLTISINAELEDEKADQDGTWEDLGTGEELVDLTLARSSLIFPLPVARILCRMFPKLSDVFWEGDPAQWGPLEEYVIEFSNCREEAEWDAWMRESVPSPSVLDSGSEEDEEGEKWMNSAS